MALPWAEASRHALLWGDSNAEHLLPLLDRAGRRAGLTIALLRPCLPELEEGRPVGEWPLDSRYVEAFSRLRQAMLTRLADDTVFDTVLLAARWSNLARVLHPPGT